MIKSVLLKPPASIKIYPLSAYIFMDLQPGDPAHTRGPVSDSQGIE